MNCVDVAGFFDSGYRVTLEYVFDIYTATASRSAVKLQEAKEKQRRSELLRCSFSAFVRCY